MSTNSFVKGKLYRFFDYVFRLVLLNFLIVIPSFMFLVIYSFFSRDTQSIWFYLTLVPAILWFFPSIVATTDVIRQYEYSQTTTIFKEFFQSLKKHFIKAFFIGIVIYIIIILLYNSFNFFNTNQNKGITYTLGFLLTISLIILVIFFIIHIPLTLAYFSELSLFQYLKLAFIMSFKDFFSSFLMVIATVILGTLDILFYYVMFFGGISLIIFVWVKLSFKNYIKIYRKVEE